jgi:diaminohydroxyphosphoribosylaminopyrimidine deaminase/5-amino-6-(5-phosphoribosylamino)uracil reductase
LGVSADEKWIRHCPELARRAEGRTSPNPIVGCVIVDGDRVVAEGWHERAGEAHAEAVALAAAGARAKGATLYVSLEPCAHVGGGRRTEPCAPKVAAAGITRVVYGLADPFPGHGGGVAQLRRARVRVDGPVLEDECRRANEAFVVYARERRAHVTLKAAMTLDGRIATASGESQWITGEAARADAHRLRNVCDVILVGAGTVAADDPKLTVRGIPGGRDPVRVVLDGRLRAPKKAQLFTLPGTTLVATTKTTKGRAHGRAELLRLPGRAGRVDLGALAGALAERGWIRLLVEGGAETHAAFLDAGLCDRLVLYLAPKIIGGRKAPAWIGGKDLAKLRDAHGFVFDGEPRRLGDDLVVELVPQLRVKRGSGS